MAIANVARGGKNTSTTIGATTLVITPATSPIAGDFIFVTVSTLAANATSGVTDSAGNKYYNLNDQVGASGRISCRYCPSSLGTVTTITCTHAAGRCSAVASTYTGVLGVGHCQKTTNAANNNTITMSPAIGAGNVMLTGMGDAAGTQTWSIVTGSLRDNQAGGGSTTPGAAHVDTIVSGGSTCAASLSVSVSGEAIAIELFSAALPKGSDTNDINSDILPPFMWSMGARAFQFISEMEPFNWGWQTPPLPAMSFNTEWDQPVQQQGTIVPEMEREQEDWGWMPPMTKTYQEDIYNDVPPTMRTIVPEMEREQEDLGFNVYYSAAGMNLMGFRGYWSLKAGMGSEDAWAFNQPPVAAVPAFDEQDMQLAQQFSYIADVDDISWGFNVPTLGGSNPQMLSWKGQWAYRSAMGMDENWSFNPVTVTAIAVFDEQDMQLAQQLTFRTDDVDSWGFNPIIVGGGGTQMGDFKGFWVRRPAMGLWEDWSFNPTVVTAVSAFDGARDQLPTGFLVRDMVEGTDAEIDQPFSTETDFEPLVMQIDLQETDSDMVQAEGFASDRVPEDFEQFVITNLSVALYWTDDEQFGKQSPFFRAFPSDDSPEQFPNFVYGNSDVDGSNFAVYLVDAPETPIPQQRILVPEMEREQEDWGWMPPMTKVGFDQDDLLPSFWLFSKADSESEQFGFNFVSPTVTTAFDQDELPVITKMSFQDVEDVVIDPVIADGMEISFYSSRINVQWLDEDSAQSTFFAQEQYADIDFQQPLMTVVVGHEDDWSLAPPVGVGGLQLMDYHGHWSLRAGMGSEVDNWSFKPPVVAVTTAFDTDYVLPSTILVRQGTDEDSSQSTFFAQEQFADVDFQTPLAVNVIGHEEDFGFNVPELIGELLLEEELQLEIYLYPIIQQVEDEQFGERAPFITSFPSDDSLEQLPNKPYPNVAEDDLVFPPSVILPNMFYDTDFNPTMQQSYYFGSEDLEKYNWGWMPPMTKVAEDDSPYDSRVQLQSYFVPEIEDEQFSWGFDRSRYYGLGDEAPYFTPPQQRSYFVPELDTDYDMVQTTFFAQEQFADQDEQFVITVQLARQWVEDDSAQSTFFAQEQFADVEQFGPAQQLSFFVPELDTDFDSAQSTFFAQEQYADIDFQNPIYAAIVADDVDVFGFNPPVVLTKMILDEELQLVNNLQPRVQQVEDEQFGFQTAVVTVNQPWDADFNPPIPLMVLADAVADFGFGISFVQAERTELPAVVLVWQATDSDIVNSTFFAQEQYGDSPETPIPQQRILVPEMEREQEDWGFAPPVGVGGLQLMDYHGHWSLRAGMQQPDTDFTMNTLVIQPWAEDQIIPIPQQLSSYLKYLGTDSDYELTKLVRIPILLVYAVGIKAALTLMSLAVTLSKLVSPGLEAEDVEVTVALSVDFFEVIG